MRSAGDAATPRRRRYWPLTLLFWTMLAAIVVCLGVMLLHACQLSLPITRLLSTQWNFCPGAPAALSVEARRGDELGRLASQLERELAEKRLACAAIPAPVPAPLQLPNSAAAPAPQQTAEAKAPPSSLPADRWARKDLGILQGCWRLGRETRGGDYIGPGKTEMCVVKTGRICFDANGSGQRETSTICPSAGNVTCTAPVSARFGNDSLLHTEQPQVACNPAKIMWTGPPNALTCHRVSDTLAMCRDAGGYEHEFRR